MARLMSFAATVPQVEDRTKTVTRRLGWKFLKAGDVLWAVDRNPRNGGDWRKLAMIEVVDVRQEKLWLICEQNRSRNPKDELAKEGFPAMTEVEFLNLFCRINDCLSTDLVTRIEFRYLDQGDPRERLNIALGPVRLQFRVLGFKILDRLLQFIVWLKFWRR